MQQLIDSGADVIVKSQVGCYSSMCDNRHSLITAGAIVDLPNTVHGLSSCAVIILVHHFQNGTTPLMFAAQEGRLSVVELLVSMGAQVNSQSNVSY